MNGKHHKNGSPFPPRKDGVLRVYNMRFCPFAHRTMLTLVHKKIPHEVINIHLNPATEKPDWFLERSPMGSVPVLELPDGRIVFDSTVCNEFLDGAYPHNKLIPDDPFEKAKIGMLKERLGKVSSSFFGIARLEKDDATLPQKFKDLKAALKPFEDELSTNFFGGSNIGMFDISIWPLIERMPIIERLSDKPVISAEAGFPKLAAYVTRMLDQDAVKTLRFDAETHVKFFLSYKAGEPQYDPILQSLALAS